MSKIRKIVFGVIFVLLAISSLAAVYYFLEIKPKLAAAKQAETPSSSSLTAVAELNPTQKDAVQPSESLPTMAERAISLDTLVQKASNKYGPEEKDRKEGFLWIDRKSSRMIVTLGALNGVLPGKYLSVYEGDQKIGQVKVETPFDVISYVKPLDGSLERFENDYYRVVIE